MVLACLWHTLLLQAYVQLLTEQSDNNVKQLGSKGVRAGWGKLSRNLPAGAKQAAEAGQHLTIAAGLSS